MNRTSSAEKQRPESGKSAWNDSDGLDAPGRPGSAVSDTSSYGDPRADKKDVQKEPNFFMKIIHAIWSTKDTQELEDGTQKAKTALRELAIYIFFLITLCVITFGMTDKNMYTLTKVMTDLFADGQFPDTKNTFRGALVQEDFWRFATGPFMDGLYWEKYYNQANVSDNDLGYVYYENKLLGIPRLRQVRVTNSSCSIYSLFTSEISGCYAEYSSGAEDTRPYGPEELQDQTAWKYHTTEALKGSNHYGTLAVYSGGGYFTDLYDTRERTLPVLESLKENLWIDRGTRAVFLDFSMFNPNLNLFCITRMTMEFPPSGGTITSWDIRTVKLLRYVSIADFVVLGFEIMFCAFTLYYMVEEIIEIKRIGKKYFQQFWNLLDITVILISLVCIALNVYRTYSVNDLLSTLINKPDQFADFEILSYWQLQFNYCVAITTFFAWIKIFKYISFNKTMTQLTTTLANAKNDLIGFGVMFFLVFGAFAQLGYLLFGTQLKDYSNVIDSGLTLFRIILGDFDFYALAAAHSTLGPTYFFMYVFFVFFVLFNMFLAIINDTYSEVKADAANQQNEFEVVDFFRANFHNLKKKLGLKKDRLSDIQDALKNADENEDKVVDYQEFKHELQLRGYTEEEIEDAFARYDTDGNRVLDQDEQAAMLQDLENQKVAALENDGEGEMIPAAPAELRRMNQGQQDEDEDDDEEEKENERKKGPKIYSEVTYTEFGALSRRVDKMEHSIGNIISKIDAVLVKLEGMEEAKLKRREAMMQLLDNIAESEDSTEETKRSEMEKLVREELERWDSEATISRPGTAASMSRPGTSMSRPRSGLSK